MKIEAQKKVLFVCLGNICRSPMAEVVFRTMAKEHGCNVKTESCGTIGFHTGSKADARAINTCLEKGYNLNEHRARTIKSSDSVNFDWILCMDEQNLHDVKRILNREDRVSLFCHSRVGLATAAIPDPYYGDDKGFIKAISMIEKASLAWIKHFQS